MSLAPSTIDAQNGFFGRLDRLGVLIAVLLVAGMAMPFANSRANRIVPGTATPFFDTLPLAAALPLAGLLVAVAVLALVRSPARLRMLASLVALGGLAIGLGIAADGLTPAGDRVARVAPAGGFWLLMLAFSLMASDAVARLRLRPWPRMGLLAVVVAAVVAILLSGLWNEVSVLRSMPTGRMGSGARPACMCCWHWARWPRQP